jgi:hypothetical protein
MAMDIQKADPEARRRAAALVVFGAAVGVVLLLWFERSLPGLSEWVTEKPELVASRARLLLSVIGVMMILPLVGFAVYTWLLGRRITSGGRFPPRSMRVLRDTVVLTGQVAESRARVMKLLALVLISLALGLLIILFWLAFSITN